MVDQAALRRPIGWWLKEADARIDAAFNASLSARDVDRRGWQVLSTLARSPSARAEVVASLTSFVDSALVDEVIEDLTDRGWVDESDDLLRLTADGEKAQASLAPLIDDVRRRVAAALPGDDYATLVQLLEQLVGGLTDPSS